jgi:prepilin-type N-terminal cleavage/methylation domain-containing protein
MNHDNKHGFTLIELMLAMSFISMLLVAIAMTTIQISNIYDKGITLREVNQAGRAVSDELQRSIASATPFDVTPKQDASPATAASRYVVRPGGGRLCLGNYTYAWNFGKALDGSSAQVFNTYANNEPVRFVKVTDSSGVLCTNPEQDIVRADAIDMLSSGDRNLVLHSFNILRTSDDPTTGQAIYAISMRIGTNTRDQLTANDASCKPPAEAAGGETYCSVNQFDIIARAGNKAGGQ